MTFLSKYLSPLAKLTLASLVFIPALSFAHTDNIHVKIVNNSKLTLGCNSFHLSHGQPVAISNRDGLAYIAPNSNVTVTLSNNGLDLKGYFECINRADNVNAAYLHTDYQSGAIHGKYYATAKLNSLSVSPAQSDHSWSNPIIFTIKSH